ncbi:DUF937 domain-containing protein [Tianweitania sp. BSSL-BM11]|uniref:DUF937 domain-containing protein n=1 Tax=Tianweitania aestuarii TaxID=2814886 RepID=A0ABS5RQZ4_9HYPH|nr:DUF937 domain-containing protein [Tianweitania aestuarii]MBS9719470.1 DUF937 domain-containing protein [Tianweitania aestuarii]
MMPLFDMLNTADNGKAMELMARQYGLTQQQVQLATEALLPAFSQGLKRNANDPYGVGSFLQAMASGDHARYFDHPSQAMGPDGTAEGNGILGHLFGSKELSRAVAAHAAQSTGIAQSILQQMLPALASMIMGGLFKQSTGQMPGQSGGNVLGDIIEQMMRGGMGGGASSGGGTKTGTTPGSSFDPFDNPFGKAMKDMMTGGTGQARESAPQSGQANNPFGGTPWGKMLEGMMGGGGMGSQAQPEPQPEPTNPSGRPRNPYDDLFGDMFETGRKTRDDYQKGTEAIFDTFLKGMEKRGA